MSRFQCGRRQNRGGGQARCDERRVDTVSSKTCRYCLGGAFAEGHHTGVDADAGSQHAPDVDGTDIIYGHIITRYACRV